MARAAAQRLIRKEHFIYERSVKAANDKIESQYQSKLDDWKTKNNVGRVSRRAPVKRHGMPDAPKLAVAASMAKWVQDDAVAKKLHAKLTDATSPPALMSGWTPVERATLTPQHVSNVIFQQ